MTIWMRRRGSHSAWARHVVGVVALAAVCLLAAQNSVWAASAMTIKADQLAALCAAGGGHIDVPTSLTISGGVAVLTDECDITPAAGARVRIVDAYIEAQSPNGDFDICFFPACGNDAKITITNSTIVACSTCGVQFRAPGSRASIIVMNSAFSSDPTSANGGTNFLSDGRVTVTGSHFLKDTTPGIHGAAGCVARKNTPETAVCN